MLDNTSGFATLAKNEAPHVVVTHCFLHRHSPSTETLPTTPKEVLSTAIKVINFIRTGSMIRRILKTCYQEMRADYEALPYNTVPWLLRAPSLVALV
jgi:hypothetical protein